MRTSLTEIVVTVLIVAIIGSMIFAAIWGGGLKGGAFPEIVNYNTTRQKVEGGWIYTTNNRPVFVPDKE
jgi:hypothetical protein